MIVCLGFLLLVSLVANAVMAAFSDYLNRRLPGLSVFLLRVIEMVAGLGLTTLLFAMIYKFMSDANVNWHALWAGTIFTAVLFSVGKNLIGLYLGKSNMANVYGAAGSIVLVLVWVFYSSQILFFGAEFIRAHAAARGLAIHSPGAK